jgi:nitrite reductase/ring-hydroxylating ferredoxin subunit
MVGVVVGGVPVVLLRIDAAVYAYEDRCAHQGMKLSAGRLDGAVLTCAAHHWTYDALSGCGLNPVAVRLRRFPVHIDGDAILVDTAATL